MHEVNYFEVANVHQIVLARNTADTALSKCRWSHVYAQLHVNSAHTGYSDPWHYVWANSGANLEKNADVNLPS